MKPEDIEALKSAVQDAIAIGAPPAAMQPINDFINRVAVGAPLDPEPPPPPPAVTMPQDEIDALKAATDEAVAAGATPESMQPISDLLDRVEPAPAGDTVTGGAGNDTVAGGTGTDTTSGGTGTDTTSGATA